jgi:hypothetical protein
MDFKMMAARLPRAEVQVLSSAFLMLEGELGFAV